jgi:hypothetical protein
VSNATIAALIAALSGVMGGLLAATATRWAERYRISQALLDKAQERRLSSIEAFMLAATAWLDWLKYIEDRGGMPRTNVPNTTAGTRHEMRRTVGYFWWHRRGCIIGSLRYTRRLRTTPGTSTLTSYA